MKPITFFIILHFAAAIFWAFVAIVEKITPFVALPPLVGGFIFLATTVKWRKERP